MERRDSPKAFLGVGWKFPVAVDKATGRIMTVSHEEDVAEAIKIILMTRPGERMMEPDFGCRLSDFVYDVMNYSVMVQLENEILNALIRWEPRIIEPEVSIMVDQGEVGKLNISISYKVRLTNNPYNIVYPYYINEGI